MIDKLKEILGLVSGYKQKYAKLENEVKESEVIIEQILQILKSQ